MKTFRKCSKCENKHMAKGLCEVHYKQEWAKSYKRGKRTFTEEQKKQRVINATKWRKNNPDRVKELSKKYYKREDPTIRRNYHNFWASKNRERIRFNACKVQMKKRKLQFDMVFEDFFKLLHSPCLYCGNSDGINTVDRIDSKIGYIKTNTQTLCLLCNLMKNKNNEELFLKQVHKIYKHKLEGANNVIK